MMTSCGESKKWREQVDKSVAKLTEGIDKAAMSVPGERYLRLIDDANSPDPARRARAQQFAKELFNIDLQHSYEVTVAFGFAEPRPLRADVFRSKLDGAIAVHNHAAEKSLNQTAVRNTILPLPTEEQVIASAIPKAKSFIEQIPEYSKLVAPSGGGFGNLQRPEYERRLANASKTLTDFLSVAIKARQDVGKQDAIRMDWSVIDDRPLLFVIIPADDWSAHSKQLTVTAVVHRKGTPTETLAQQRVYSFDKAEFRETSIAVPGLPPQKIMYASHNMTGHSFISGETAAEAQRLKNLLDNYASQR